MRARKIIRVVDALAAQQRVILWLECEHKVTVNERELRAQGWNVQRIKEQPHAMCPFCPDPPPEVTQAQKTPTQLWKEAGEP